MMRGMLSKLGLGVAALLLISATPAQASPPEEAGGTWLYIPTVVAERTAGCNTFLDTTEEGIWDGTFVGESFEVGNVVIHCNGRLGFMAIVTFDEVTVDGKVGSLQMSVNGVNQDPAIGWVGHWVVLSGSGELENLRGNGTFWGPGWLGNPTEYGEIFYEGKVKFTPSR